MTTIASKVCHHCCNPDHLGTCFCVASGSGAFCSFLGSVTACFVKPTLTGVLSGVLGGGAIGAFAGASAVTAYYAKCDEGSGDSKTVVVDYVAHGQPSFTTRVVSKEPSWGGQRSLFNPDSSTKYYESNYTCYDGGGCDGGGSGGGGGGGCDGGGGGCD